MRSVEHYAEDDAAFFMDPDVAEAYAVRPGYPPEAIRHMLASASFDSNPHPYVLDAGCGSGQLTAGLIEEVALATIVAMDQSEAMVSRLPRSLLGQTISVVGNFNQMPFGDSYFDLVTFGTALHWGDPRRLPQELSRVLRSGGVVASISNVTRAGTRFSEILDTLPGHAARSNPMTAHPRSLDLGVNFNFVGFEEFPNDLPLTDNDFRSLLASIEVYGDAPPELRRGAEQAMDEYANDKNNRTADGYIVVPYDTFVRLARVTKPDSIGATVCKNTIR